MPFGEVFIEERNNTWNTPFLFNGKEFDAETGLYYYGARYYNPRVSIFYGVDPLVKETMLPYAYAANNPIRFIDVNGENPEEPEKSSVSDDFKLNMKEIGKLVNESGEKAGNAIISILNKVDKAVQGKGSGDPVVDSKAQGYRLVQFGDAPPGNVDPFAIDGHAKENLDIGNGYPLSVVDRIAAWTEQFFGSSEVEGNLPKENVPDGGNGNGAKIENNDSIDLKVYKKTLLFDHIPDGGYSTEYINVRVPRSDSAKTVNTYKNTKFK